MQGKEHGRTLKLYLPGCAASGQTVAGQAMSRLLCEPEELMKRLSSIWPQQCRVLTS